MIKEIYIKIKRLNNEFNDIPLPSYLTKGSSGLDVRAAIKDELLIHVGEISLVSTNLSFEIPEGYEIQVRPRSGLAVKHGIGILNSPGTIDSDYRGEVKIIMVNFGKEDYKILRGERIAQLIVSKVYTAKIIESTELNDSERAEGGFGHTGKS
ncbi:MAG TPA: dUTP diphosphatase [Ignavibacteria bacterium]|nr:dUTP diphosphatase [Ignavibacteria bacterium]